MPSTNVSGRLMNAMPAARAIILVAMTVSFGAGCGDSQRDRDEAALLQKEWEDKQISGNADKLAAKAGKLEADITNYENNLTKWRGKRAEADANARAAYDRGTSVGARVGYAAASFAHGIHMVYGGTPNSNMNTQAEMEAANAQHCLDERDQADREIAVCQDKLNKARAELGTTRQWMTEAANTSAKNIADTSRQVVRPPVVMPPAGGCGPRR
jgi:hypothetical protein